MAGKTETAKAQVIIDGKEAAWELENIKKKTKELKAEMDKAFKSGDKDLWTKLKGQADDLDASVKKVKATSIDVAKVLKNLNGTSFNDLNKAQKQITAELSKMERGTKDYIAKSADLQKVEAELKKVKAEMHGVSATGGTLQKLGLSFKEMFSISAIVGGVATAVQSLISGVKELVMGSIDAYEESIKAEKLLTYTMQGREDVTERLIEFADELQWATGVDDETIKSQESFLALQGRSEEQIKKIIKAALDMSKAIPGMDFSSALKTLDATMEGNIGKMGRLEDSLKTLSEEELKSGKAVEILGEKYKGAAEESVTFKDKLKVVWGETQEAVGGFIVSTVKAIAYVVTFGQAFRDATDDSDDFRNSLKLTAQEQQKLSMFIALSNAKLDLTKAKTLDGINATKLQTQAIAAATDQYTKYYETFTSVADLEKEKSKLDKEFSKEQLKAINDRITALNNQANSLGIIEGLEKKISDLEALRKTAKTVADINSYSAQIEALQKQLDLYTKQSDLLKKSKKTEEEIAKSKAESLKKIQEESISAYTSLSEKIKSIREKMGLEAKSEDQKELDAINDKYDAQIDALQTNINTSENLIYENQEKMAKAKADGNTEEYNRLVEWNSLLINEVSKGIDLQLKLEDEKNAAILIKTEEQNKEKLELQANINDKMAALFMTSSEKEKADKIKQYQEILDLAKKNGLDTTDLYKKVQEELEKIKNGTDLKGIFGLDEKGVAELKDAISQVESFLGQFTTLWDSINSLKKAKEDGETQRFLSNIEKQKKALKEQLEHKQISQASYDKKMEALDAAATSRKNKAAYLQAKREAQAAKARIMIQAAVASAKAILEHWPLGLAEVPFILLSAGVQIAAINEGLENMPQAYSGKYPVTGASDGKTYNATVMNNAKTGILNSPTILAGEQPEIIIDPTTTKRLQMDYPGILNAIYAVAGRVPQFASGNYPAQNTSVSAPIINSDPNLLAIMQEISRKLDNPTRAKVVYTEFEEIKTKVDETRSNFNG